MKVTRKALMADPAVSFWLKRALVECAQRDPVDSLADAELLAKVLREELQELSARDVLVVLHAAV